MAIPIDTELYEYVKKEVNKMYKKSSAYRSGMYVQLYKQLGGRYKDEGKTINDKPLRRWFQEKWEDVNPNKTETSYPVYRPTKRITKKTPKTKDEVSEDVLLQQSKLKQKIKGKKNLPKF